MRYIADLHLHSKFSRATARNLDLENLHAAALQKGVTVVGTGDFTHPAWVEEIRTKLEPAEQGLFRLKASYAGPAEAQVPEACRGGEVRFILQCEISNIYKKNGRVRKNHNLVYFPDIKSVEKFNAILDGIGNIKSDGRPILGLDARKLLEIMLDVNDRGMFVPAHIWTPWFSLFGSKSGFDTIEECFEELTDRIFAVETGLSSDPPMNWRIKDLDRVRLISSSDAHSPGMLGRNASVFNTHLSYDGIYDALAGADFDAFEGTLDMYPDQGKYHYDGHRKCSVCLNPATTQKIKGLCPECGRPVTCGVLYRVQELASRPEGFRPEKRHGYRSIIPMTDILSEIFGVGPKTKKVATHYLRAIEKLGPELHILLDLPRDSIQAANVPLLAEAVTRMRNGQIHIDPGYDGAYGVVNIFSNEERQALKGEKKLLVDLPSPRKSNRKSKIGLPKRGQKQSSRLEKGAGRVDKETQKTDLLESLNPEQREAVESEAGAVIVQAGPGTGKTRTLTARIAWLISHEQVAPQKILALTFTNKSARELATRIKTYIPNQDRRGPGVASETFHSFCLKMLKTHHPVFNATLIDDEARLAIIREAFEDRIARNDIKTADRFISDCKQRLLSPEEDLSFLAGYEALERFARVYRRYRNRCRKLAVIDFEDLIFETVMMMRANPEIDRRIRKAYPFIFIDEYQDLNYGQYMLARMLAEGGRIFVIGDPDQSIYGFRGSDNRFFGKFEADFPGCRKIRLSQNYRSSQTILDASFQVMSGAVDSEAGIRVFSDIEGARKLIIKETATEQAEAVSIGRMIEKMIGGTSFFSMDSGRTASHSDGLQKEYSFSDFAVLYRTGRQARVFESVFEKEGIPFQSADRIKMVETPGIRELISMCRILTDQASIFDLVRLLEYYQTGETDRIKTQMLEEQHSNESAACLLSVFKGIIERCQASLKKATVLNAASILERIDHIKKQADALNRTGQLEDTVELIAAQMRLLNRFDNQPEFLGMYEKVISQARVSDNLAVLIENLVLGQDADTLRPGVEKVSLMTLHAAKGLEFPVVFVTGCEQGLIPFAKDGKRVGNPQEERRLFYVGMTRAMDILCLTYARKRRIYGRAQERQRSIFIKDIEKELIKFDSAPFRAAVKKTQTQLELF